jgi:hypothetical protein
MTVPRDIFSQLKSRLEAEANRIGWASLGLTEKSLQYDQWTRDPAIGGVLARYLDLRQVRVYIKDTLLKDYHRKRLGAEERPFRVLGIPAGIDVEQTFIKPHGRLLVDGQLVCWGRADAWKTILTALYERSYGRPNVRPTGAVLSDATGRFRELQVRDMVETAARRLGIGRVVWLED